MNSIVNGLEDMSMASLYFEGDAYDWFTWWSKKTSGFSVNWQMFTKDFLKRFLDDEEDDTFTRFTHLKQIGT